MRVLAISGSLRRDSYNTKLLRAAEELAPAGVEFELYDRLAEVPPYDADLEDEEPETVHDLRERLALADAVLFATPEYNSSIPGQLKNALDWASRPYPDNSLWGRTVAVVGASTGAYGAAWAQAELRKVLGTIGARVVQSGVAVTRAPERFNAEGELVDTGLRARLREVLRDLVAAAEPAPARAA
jgi:chromate reductase